MRPYKRKNNLTIVKKYFFFAPHRMYKLKYIAIASVTFVSETLATKLALASETDSASGQYIVGGGLVGAGVVGLGGVGLVGSGLVYPGYGLGAAVLPGFGVGAAVLPGFGVGAAVIPTLGFGSGVLPVLY